MICLFAMLSAMICGAQDGTNSNAGVAGTGISNGQQEDDIISRLTGSSAGVSIEGPAVLFQRAMALPESEADAQMDELNGETEEEQDQDQNQDKPRVRGKQVGYRVQVYADNNVRSAKTEARQRERAIGSSFPQYGTYVSYASPFWRLRVGDFRSQYEAEKAAAEIKRQFPGYAREVRVVRDRVNVK